MSMFETPQLQPWLRGRVTADTGPMIYPRAGLLENRIRKRTGWRQSTTSGQSVEHTEQTLVPSWSTGRTREVSLTA